MWKLAYLLAVKNGCKYPKTWDESDDWFSAYMKRNPTLPIKRPEASNLARVKMALEEEQRTRSEKVKRKISLPKNGNKGNKHDKSTQQPIGCLRKHRESKNRNCITLSHRTQIPQMLYCVHGILQKLKAKRRLGSVFDLCSVGTRSLHSRSTIHLSPLWFWWWLTPYTHF